MHCWSIQTIHKKQKDVSMNSINFLRDSMNFIITVNRKNIFVMLCFLAATISLTVLCNLFAHILEGWVTGTGQFWDYPHVSEVTLKDLGKISRYLTRNVSSKTWLICQFIGFSDRVYNRYHLASSCTKPIRPIYTRLLSINFASEEDI